MKNDYIEWLKRLKLDNEALAGSWNGEDEHFSHEGEAYTEDDARRSQDIAEAADELIKLLEE